MPFAEKQHPIPMEGDWLTGRELVGKVEGVFSELKAVWETDTLMGSQIIVKLCVYNRLYVFLFLVGIMKYIVSSYLTSQITATSNENIHLKTPIECL